MKRAHGVGVSRILSMDEVLGSIPSVSNPFAGVGSETSRSDFLSVARGWVLLPDISRVKTVAAYLSPWAPSDAVGEHQWILY
ncbi:hypothetical protein EX30DRAFT_248295 [Ascodesmis nigricans]|uniref:Uncharacterized protein n=1 Tax=Ascodesmis nigricans TaxID=341454 RepID=A0A4S2MHS8_9PEZI|nr:hypothetical protein EX30DRAFT_248295 [Ascodesmis nigricans]